MWLDIVDDELLQIFRDLHTWIPLMDQSENDFEKLAAAERATHTFDSIHFGRTDERKLYLRSR